MARDNYFVHVTEVDDIIDDVIARHFHYRKLFCYFSPCIEAWIIFPREVSWSRTPVLWFVVDLLMIDHAGL